MQTFFSVIIPVFNRERLIHNTLSSVLSQKECDYEVIVVDDGSTDKTIEEIGKLKREIKLLKQSNKGPGAARNLGIQNATGKYIVFLDSDDLWFPWTLKTYKHIIEKYDLPSFISGEVSCFESEEELALVKAMPPKATLFDDYFSTSHQSLWIQPGSVAIRADILQASGGFTGQRINAEDCDLWLKLGTAGKFVRIHSPTLLAYRQHPGSAISNINRSFLGIFHLIQQEKSKCYPGGKVRQKERIRILTRHLRPVSLECIRLGNISQGFQLYLNSCMWHMQLLRIKYLLIFPLLLALATIQSCWPHNHTSVIQKVGPL